MDRFHRLRLAIILPAFYALPKRILVRGQVIDPRAGYRAAQAETIFIEDERLYAAFRPLRRGQSLEIEVKNGCLVLSLIDYHGASRLFSRTELQRTLNGFVAEIASAPELLLEQFRRRVATTTLTDDRASGERLVDNMPLNPPTSSS